MLNVLRSSVKESPILKWVLLAVGIGLIAYLGNYFVGDSGGPVGADWVARVNGVEIPRWRFQEEAREQDRRYRDLLGSNYEQLKPQLQIPRQAIEKLIVEQLIMQDARRMGLKTSSADLAEMIRNDPGLRDANGQFIGTERYKQLLDRNWRGGVAGYERSLSDRLLRSQWAGLVTQPVHVGDEELRELFRVRTEKTEIDYVVVTAADQEVAEDVSDEEARGWYEAHLDQFMRDAGREIRYVLVDRAALMESIEIGEEAIRSYYESSPEAYAHPDQRRARHILFRFEPGATDADKAGVRGRAEEALARLRGGESFEALAKELSEDVVSAQRGGDLDFFSREQMVGPFADAVFETNVGEYAPITESPYGIHVIEVTDSRAAGTAPLEDVEADIRRLLRARQVDDRLGDEARRLREAIASADRLEEVAAEEGLSVEKAFFSLSAGIPELRTSPDFDADVAALEVGTLSAPLNVGAGMAIVVVDEVLPEAAAPFDDVRTEVTAGVLAEKRMSSAVAAARTAYERREDVASAARSLGREVKQSGALAPGQALPDAGGSTAALEPVLFGEGVSVGDGGVIEVPNGALVFEITAREPFDPRRFESEREQLLRETLGDRREQYFQALINHLRLQQQIEYNPAWLEALEI